MALKQYFNTANNPMATAPIHAFNGAAHHQSPGLEELSASVRVTPVVGNASLARAVMPELEIQSIGGPATTPGLSSPQI